MLNGQDVLRRANRLHGRGCCSPATFGPPKYRTQLGILTADGPKTRSLPAGHVCETDSGRDGRSAMMNRRLSRRQSRLSAGYCAWGLAISPPPTALPTQHGGSNDASRPDARGSESPSLLSRWIPLDESVACPRPDARTKPGTPAVMQHGRGERVLPNRRHPATGAAGCICPPRVSTPIEIAR